MSIFEILKKLDILSLVSEKAQDGVGMAQKQRIVFNPKPCLKSDLPALLLKINENSLKEKMSDDGLSKEQKDVLRTELNKIIQLTAATETGQKVLAHLPGQAKIICCTEGSTLKVVRLHITKQMGSSLPELAVIKIEPDVVLGKDKAESVETVAHEAAHIMHYKMVKFHKDKDALNPYDHFFLKFWDEAGAKLTGFKASQEIAYKKGVDFFNKLGNVFDNQQYADAFLNQSQREILNSLNPRKALERKHSKAFYEIQRQYFDLYPELKSPILVGCIHRLYQVACNRAMSEIGVKRISTNDFCR